jgi:plasmid maintenance system antidote protein VapI
VFFLDIPFYRTRLSAALGTSPEFWLKMQMQYDLWQAQKAKRPRIRRFQQVPKAKGLAVA